MNLRENKVLNNKIYIFLREIDDTKSNIIKPADGNILVIEPETGKPLEYTLKKEEVNE